MSLHPVRVQAQGTAASVQAPLSGPAGSATAPAAPANPTPAATPATQTTATDPASRVMAREFATRGAEAFDRGAFSEALDDFNRAAALFDAPTIAIMQARTLVKLGRWLEGLDRYQQTARQTLTPADPPPYHDAIRQAVAEGDALRQQLPQLTVVVDPKEQQDIVITLDGQTLQPLLLNTRRPIDPGTHRLQASKGGAPFLQRSVDTAPGQHVELRVALPTAKPVVVAVPPPKHVVAQAASAPAPVADEAETNWPLVGVATIGGVGAVGALLTTVLGSVAQGHLDDACRSPTQCEPEQKADIDKLDTARALFYVSSAMFVIGGSLTTYLLLTDGDSSTGAQAKLAVSPFGAQLVTKF